MTASFPGPNPSPFSSAELGGVELPADEVAAATRIAHELETAADRSAAWPSAAFADRIMAAVAAEPTPAPAVAAGAALRRHSAVGLLASVRDAVRVAFGRGFPVAARAQAMALVLLAAVVAGTGGVATAGAFGLLGRGDRGPAPSSVTPVVTAAPQASPDVAPSPEPSSAPPTPGDTAEPASGTPEASESPEPSETPDPHASTSGTSGGPGGPGTTPRPTGTPSAAPTPAASGGGGDHGSPSPTPELLDTPVPTATPEP